MSDQLQELFAERRRKCEADQKIKDDAERAERLAEQAALRAKNEARRQAILADPKSPKAIQARYAEDVRRKLAEEKRRKGFILKQIEEDKLIRKEKQERVRQNAQIAAEKARLELSSETSIPQENEEEEKTMQSIDNDNTLSESGATTQLENGTTDPRNAECQKDQALRNRTPFHQNKTSAGDDTESFQPRQLPS